MENNSPMDGVVPAQVVGNRVVAPKKQGALSQVFSHFTRREFWIELLDSLVKTAFSGFLIAVGNTLLEAGKKKAGASTTIFDNLGTQRPQSPAAQAYSRGYASTPQNYAPSYPPATVGHVQSNSSGDFFPGFPRN